MVVTNETTSNEVARVRLSGCLDVRTASDLQKKLLEHTAANNPVELDCSEVESIDTACLQLLVAAKRELADKLHVLVDDESEAAKWIRLSGLSGLLLATNN